MKRKQITVCSLCAFSIEQLGVMIQTILRCIKNRDFIHMSNILNIESKYEILITYKREI